MVAGRLALTVETADGSPVGAEARGVVAARTQQAAFATGTAPIPLIDGDKLIDLLVEHGIGVPKRAIGLLGVDAEASPPFRRTTESALTNDR